jgi:hypothetical protein
LVEIFVAQLPPMQAWSDEQLAVVDVHEPCELQAQMTLDA